jgi:hypothetical protein
VSRVEGGVVAFLGSLQLSLSGVVSGLVAAILFSALGFIFKVLFYEPNRKRRRRATVLGFSVRDAEFAPTLIVGPTDSVETGVYMRPTVGYGSLLAVAYVAQVVGDVSPVSSRSEDLEVFLAGDQVATMSLSRDNEHNILIGGPQRNSNTMDFLNQLNEEISDGKKILRPSRRFSPARASTRGHPSDGAIAFPEDPDRRKRSLHIDGYEFVAQLSSSAANGTRPDSASIATVEGTDYGLIIRSNAPQDAGRLVVLAGVHTFGSAGASKFLAELAQVRRPLVRRLRGRRTSEDHYIDALRYLREKAHLDLVLVVRAEVQQGMLTSSRLIAAWEIEDCEDA